MSKTAFFFFMQILYFIILSCFLHPIHISKCQLEVNGASNKLELTIHVYIDDLQEAIQQSGSPELFLATKKEIANADDYIAEYLSKHFVIKNDDNIIALNWVGKEQSDDLFAFWCFLESDEIDEELGIEVEYSVLHDLYDDQNNILNVIKSDGDEHYFLIRKGDDAVTF